MAFRRACQRVAKYLDSKEFRERGDSGMTLKGDFVPLLIDINKLGLLTFDSQEGFEHPKVPMSEKAYVCGFMETKRAEIFVRKLNALTDKVGLIVVASDEDGSRIPVTVMFSKPEWPKAYDTDEYKDSRKDLKKYFELKKKLFKQDGFVVETGLWTAMSSKSLESEWKEATKLKKREMKGYSMIACFDPKFNRRSDREGGLLYDMLDVLETV